MSAPVLLVILDGFGVAPPGPGNAVELAATPVFDALVADHPQTTLAASGRAVGLPDGQMGNSEVGHLTIGAGAVLDQDLVRVGRAAADGSLAENAAYVAALARAAAAGRPIHLIGLVSDGGVHSHVDHLRVLAAAAQARGVGVRVHAITDGRDVSPHQAATLLAALEQEWAGSSIAVATVCGRLYAMDRDARVERTQRFLDALVERRGTAATSASAAVAASYAGGTTDEFVEPVIVGTREDGRVRDGDEVVFFNFRPDRARQICASLAPRVGLTTLTAYWPDGGPAGIAVMFPPEWPSAVLASAIAGAGRTQLHAAETEKYPHVTYFLNGGRETPFDGEQRILVPSPRDVKTYDLKPEMSAAALAADVAAALRRDRPDFTIVNFANPDMVGHTGVIPAVIRAVEAADAGLGVVLAALGEIGGRAIVTADHGNAEKMLTETGEPHTAHTTNPVPVVCTDPLVTALRDGGSLIDLAPTVLALLELDPPASMTGRSLIA